MLEVRGLKLSDEQLARIEACADEARLRRWLEQAAAVRLPVDFLDT